METNCTTAAIDLMCAAGMLPADDESFPSWVAAYYDGAIATGDGYLVAVETEGAIRMHRITTSGAILAGLAFPMCDDTVTADIAAAFTAVAVAWAAS